MPETKMTARDGKPGCPVTVWDGPYSTRCGAGASTGRCAHHGPFAVAAPETDDAPKPTLTEAERTNLGSFTDGTYACASEAYCSGYDDNRPGHMHENLYDCVTNIVANHVAAARREAWDEGVRAAHRSRLTLFAIRRVNPYALAEPERDEEGR